MLGNGQGFSTTQPAFGFPAGGLGPDNRLGLYIADTWKMFPNFTVNLGLRYDRDTGRTDSDLPGLPFLNNLIPTWPNLGAPIPNPNLNFGPSLGIAWDPWKTGKTVIRAGIGLYYENVIWNNVLFDRPLRLPTGAFLQTPTACDNGQAFALPGVSLIGGQAQCGTPSNPIRIGDAGSAIAQLQSEYQALVAVQSHQSQSQLSGELRERRCQLPTWTVCSRLQDAAFDPDQRRHSARVQPGRGDQCGLRAQCDHRPAAGGGPKPHRRRAVLQQAECA